MGVVPTQSTSILELDTIINKGLLNNIRGLTSTVQPVVFLSDSHLKELSWVIPLAIGFILTLVLVALLCFYGVRTLEQRMASCCYNTFGCCRPQPSDISDESFYLSKDFNMRQLEGYSSTSALHVNT
ncbi:neuronal acetylcholine receptor subunit alpha-3 [Plakobranchus ocellatus]|uniref:Neuronal acetylcholine receptor subunit alpha-3 n=1 Tax=Plakobranchus ocellatus TaxID=259542 RepID=A0AAV4DLD9_9GAST|nr:neuronal acetylcholine receptor subunit alpha-3 [Plakobranchus ocellatus]